MGPEMSREDPVFGLIEFRRFKTFSKQIREDWDGEVEFAPTGALVEVSLVAPEEGPSERQRALFREIEARYMARLPAMLAALHASWEEATLEYELVGIEIAGEEKPTQWTAHFTVDWNEFYGMSFFVTLTDWKITDIMGVD